MCSAPRRESSSTSPIRGRCMAWSSACRKRPTAACGPTRHRKRWPRCGRPTWKWRATSKAAGTDPVRVRIIGIGMGPAHVTPEAAEALRSVDYVLAADKGADDGLLALGRAVVDAHAEGAVEIVHVADPPRNRSADLSAADYEGAVADWHDAR